MAAGGERATTAGAADRLRFWDPSARGLTPVSHAALAAFSLAVLAYYLLSEKVPVGGGFGWDGCNYASWVRAPGAALERGALDDYRVRRILPSLLVAAPARLLGLPATRDYIVFGFAALNACCVHVAGVFWARTCAALRLGGARTLAGMLLVLVGFATLKMAAYYPVLTDLPALASAMVMLDCWVRGRRLRLAAVVVAAMFIWPSTAIVGTLLLLFPRGSSLTLGRLSRFAPHASVAAALAVGALAVRATVVVRNEWGPLPLHREWLPVSIAVTIGYVYLVSRAVLGAVSGGEGRPRLSWPGLPQIATWAVAVVATACFQKWMAPKPFAWSLSLKPLVVASVNRPGIFLAADFAYYGALAVLAGLFLRGAAREAAGLGLGVLGVVAFGLALNLFPEVRMGLNVVPFLALAVVLAAPLDRPSPAVWTFLAACQLAVGKVWLTIAAAAADFSTPAKLLEFPAQRYFLSHGPWMTDGPYLVQGGAAVVATIAAALLLRRRPPPVAESSAAGDHAVPFRLMKPDDVGGTLGPR